MSFVMSLSSLPNFQGFPESAGNRNFLELSFSSILSAVLKALLKATSITSKCQEAALSIIMIVKSYIINAQPNLSVCEDQAKLN
jgi:hypothetical protein